MSDIKGKTKVVSPPGSSDRSDPSIVIDDVPMTPFLRRVSIFWTDTSFR